MADAFVNIEELLTPISADAPSGIDPRADLSATSPFRAIKDLRNRNRTAERKIDQGDDVDPPDWAGILESSVALLKTSAKDLEVGCWALEALVRLDGFAGLSSGFRLLEQLAATFWETIYPRPEDGDASYRTMPIANLNGVESSEGTLLQPISRVPLTQGRTAGPFARWHYKQAIALEARPAESRARSIEEGSTSNEKLQQAAAETDGAFFRASYAAVTESIARFDALTNVLNEKCGVADAPPSSTIRSALEDCLQIIKSLAGAKLAEPVAAAAPVAGVTNGTSSGGTASNGVPRISFTSPEAGVDREQIFQTILACAEAWRKLEPQSLLPPMLERAVAWGKLPVDQLMRAIITEDGALSSLTRLTGVKYYTKEDS